MPSRDLSFAAAQRTSAVSIAELISFATVELRTTAEPSLLLHSAQSAFFSLSQTSFLALTITPKVFPPNAASAGADQSNVCIFADREVDRSPTGTDTSGRAAQLFLRGKLGLHQPYVNASIVGSRFEVRVVEAVKVGAFDGAVTEVTGDAHIMSFNQWVLERDDPFPQGFFLR